MQAKDIFNLLKPSNEEIKLKYIEDVLKEIVESKKKPLKSAISVYKEKWDIRFRPSLIP